jgi:hypothetical protein
LTTEILIGTGFISLRCLLTCFQVPCYHKTVPADPLLNTWLAGLWTGETLCRCQKRHAPTNPKNGHHRANTDPISVLQAPPCGAQRSRRPGHTRHICYPSPNKARSILLSGTNATTQNPNTQMSTFRMFLTSSHTYERSPAHVRFLSTFLKLLSPLSSSMSPCFSTPSLSPV